MPRQRYRPLTTDEIATLEKRGCAAENWRHVLVGETFAPHLVRDTVFTGEVRLEGWRDRTQRYGGASGEFGIAHAHLHNCTVGPDVLIRNIGRRLADYEIGEGATIHNVACLEATGESDFGQGAKVDALNEDGGRTVTLYDRLSAQVAYLLAAYRHRPRLIARLEELIDAYVRERKRPRGYVGAGARVLDSGELRDVHVGPAAVVRGAARLVNGTVGSTPGEPALVGAGVVAEDFVFAPGSEVTGAAVLHRCFVGQGAYVGKGFAADHSLFFANCDAFNGEACAAFCGPYTVSHHKATLLLTALYSFHNAGSGGNASNHRYKLGPVHQGILERGCKTGSSSYLLYPARVGAFTTVIGRHYAALDTSDMPFSLLLEEKGQSLLIPAGNLFSIGVYRDGRKWAARDRRAQDDRLDCIHCHVLSPYTMARVMRARKILNELRARESGDAAGWNGLKIPARRLAKAAQGYDTAVHRYVSGAVVRQAESVLQKKGPGDFLANLMKSGDVGAGEWVDLCGLLAPRAQAEALLDSVENGSVGSIEGLEMALRHLHERYVAYEWDWAKAAWLDELRKDAEAVTAGDVRGAVEEWRAAVHAWHERIRDDAEKEFGDAARIGYGIDGDDAIRHADFEAVRGTLTENPVVQELAHEAEDVDARAEKLIEAVAGMG